MREDYHLWKLWWYAANYGMPPEDRMILMDMVRLRIKAARFLENYSMTPARFAQAVGYETPSNP